MTKIVKNCVADKIRKDIDAVIARAVASLLKGK